MRSQEIHSAANKCPALPIYGGQCNLNTTMKWLNCIENAISTLEVSAQEVYDYLPRLLDDKARIWFIQRIRADGDFLNRMQFRTELLNTFIGPEWETGLEVQYN